MKLTMDFEEMKKLLVDTLSAASRMKVTGVRLIHRYGDGSGEDDADNITSIDRVEFEVEDPPQ